MHHMVILPNVHIYLYYNAHNDNLIANIIETFMKFRYSKTKSNVNSQ